MHITLEADYAVRIVEQLARTEEKQDAKTISEKTGVPLRFSLKILRTLVSDSIVRSYKGAKGGYTLAKKPSDITLCEVIESVEGKYQFSRCLEDEFPCTCMGQTACRFHSVYNEISEIVRTKLTEITFEV